MTKQFTKSLSTHALNLEGKIRSNIFPWRGQFSPELIENILDAYCSSESIILDPFCGSGTVLCEAGLYGVEAIGVELNPAAYILSRTYELINLDTNELNDLVNSFVIKFQKAFPEPHVLSGNINELMTQQDFNQLISKFKLSLSIEESYLADTFIILLDLHKNDITQKNIYSALYKVINAVKKFPNSRKKITAMIGDSRSISLDSEIVDFVITSPPYINVFNYHQNYRRSAESLGWDLLKIARSEIGSNRANRGNRFLTVIQYCFDMGLTLVELYRTTKKNGKMLFVVGHESSVLGVPFYNAEIIAMLAVKSNLFDLVLRQNRTFKNKFGKLIREDLLHFEKKLGGGTSVSMYDIAKEVAFEMLERSLSMVQPKNKDFLIKAIKCVGDVDGTPLYHSDGVRHYNSQDKHTTIGVRNV